MLEMTLPARIRLTMDLGDNLWLVYLESSDLEDAIVNVCTNAMHAIEGDGLQKRRLIKPCQARDLLD